MMQSCVKVTNRKLGNRVQISNEAAYGHFAGKTKAGIYYSLAFFILGLFFSLLVACHDKILRHWDVISRRDECEGSHSSTNTLIAQTAAVVVAAAEIKSSKPSLHPEN